MNYEDELERSRARRSRARGTGAAAERGAREDASREYRTETGSRLSRSAGEGRGRNGSGGSTGSAGRGNEWASLAEPGSRADRNRASGGRPSGSYKRNRNGKKNWKKIAIGVAIGLVALIAAAVIGVYAYLNSKLSDADRNPFDTEVVENPNLSLAMKEKMEEGYWTIAVFGVDSRDSSTGKGNQSDVIMIVNIDRKSGEIKLVSVFRDTYLNINDKNTYNKINAAYAQGGPEQAVKALNKNLDLNITHYATFNWKAVATAINILGGVDIEISKSEYYYINAFITETVKGTGIGSVQLKGPGMHHMDGVQAVAYGRLRLMDTDYARTERQRIVIQKAFEKAKKANLSTLNSLVGNMFAMCATNINFNDIAAMVPNVAKYHLGETAGFPMARGEQVIKGADCVVPQTLVSNVTSLHNFLFGEENYTPSGTVQTISKKISDASGLYKAGKEIDHVPTDQGYIPKATTAPAKTTEAAREEETTKKESESTLERETDEDGNLIESSEGENGSSAVTESTTGTEEGMNAGNWETRPTYPFENPMESSSSPGNWPTKPAETNEDGGPKSPLDVTRETEDRFGPGHETATEATMSPGGNWPGANRPGGNGTVTEPTTSGSSIIVTQPTTAPTPTTSQAVIPTSPAPTAPSTTPSSPADMTLPSGNTGGPAGQATLSANPGGM